MNQLKTWADLFDNCTFAAKKMIVSQFMKSIHVYRECRLEIAVNVSFDELKNFLLIPRISAMKKPKYTQGQHKRRACKNANPPWWT